MAPILVVLAVAWAASVQAGVPGEVDRARDALQAYDARVKKYKAAHGFNTTLQLDDPCPEVLSTEAAVPLSSAAVMLEALLAREPEQPEARGVLARIRGRQGRDADAVRLLADDAARHPGSAAAWNVLGVAVARKGGAGALARKTECYRKAVALDPKDPVSWANLCNALVSSRTPAEAIEAGLKAVALRPHYVYGWMNLGVAYGLKGDVAQEEQAYLAAINVPPSEERCPFARFNLALGYEKRGQMKQAVAWYRDALRVGLPQGPNSRTAALFHHSLARALFRMGDFPASVFEAREAMRIDATIPEPYSLLGHLFEKSGDAKSARRMYQAATRMLAKYGPSRPEEAQRHAE